MKNMSTQLQQVSSCWVQVVPKPLWEIYMGSVWGRDLFGTYEGLDALQNKMAGDVA